MSLGLQPWRTNATFNHHGWVPFGAALAVLALGATPADAQPNRFKVYVAAGCVTPLDSDEADLGEVTDTIEASAEVGYGIGFEWRTNQLFGVELDDFRASHDVELGGLKIAETDVTPLTLAVNFHLVRTRFLDFYLGPTVSYVDWGDVEFTSQAAELLEQSSVAADSETAVGVQLGLDIGIGPDIAVVTGVRYMDRSITPEGASDGLAVNPLIARVGAAWRW